MRGYLEEVGSLPECLLDHTILLNVKILESLLQIPNATVDEFSTSTASTRREIVPLHTRGVEA